MTSNDDDPWVSVDRLDEDRSIDAGGEDTEVDVPLDAPVETPIDDLVDQRRAVPIGDDDDR